MIDETIPFYPQTETMEDLGRAGMRLIQPKDHFRYGTDSVLLAHFAAEKRFFRAIDLGTGCGVIALLLCARMHKARVDGVEIQPWAADMAARNVLLNRLDDRVRIHEGDLCTAACVFGYEQYDLVVSNPPYFDAETSLQGKRPSVNAARQDALCTPDMLAQAAFSLLKTGGRFSVVYPAARVLSILRAMEQNRIAPKRLRCIQDTPSAAPKLLLVEGVKQGGEGVVFCPPLVLRNANGTPTEEYQRIYDY